MSRAGAAAAGGRGADPAADAQRLAAAALRAPNPLPAVRLVLIDGRAGSGKSTLAGALAAAVRSAGRSAAVIALDDLYAGWSGPADPMFATRMQAWIVDPLRGGDPVRHRVYDWSADRFGGWRWVPRTDVLIVEGVGAATAVLAEPAVLRVWLDVPPGLRRSRAADRAGPHDQGAGPHPDLWWDAWAAAEQAYLDAEQPQDRCDVVLRPASPPG